MRYALLMFTILGAATAVAMDATPKDLLAQLYQAHRSKHDPLNETQQLGRYFAPELLKLYLKDKREAKGEVGRLDGDPLYNAQDFEIKDLTISPPEDVGAETLVVVRFKNMGKATRVVYVLVHTGDGWRISDIRYDDGASLVKILKGNG